MCGARLLTGMRTGAFILTSDANCERWDISRRHFAGREIYRLKGSPANPNRPHTSQFGSRLGEHIQRSTDGKPLVRPRDKPYRDRQANTSMRRATGDGSKLTSGRR